MPSAFGTRWYRLNISQLIRMTGHGGPKAQDALEKYNKLKQGGGEPLAFLSGVSNFWVLDENDENNRSRIRRLNDGSKPYPS